VISRFYGQYSTLIDSFSHLRRTWQGARSNYVSQYCS